MSNDNDQTIGFEGLVQPYRDGEFDGRTYDPDEEDYVEVEEPTGFGSEEWQEERRLAEELSLRAVEADQYVEDLLDEFPGDDPAARLHAVMLQPVRPFDAMWEPLDDTDATWALRIMAHAKAEQDRMKEAAEEEISKVRAWLKRSTSGPAATYAHFEALMIAYRMRCEQARDDYPATYKLPTGTLTRRQGSTSYVVTEPEVFVEWAIENDRDAVKVEPLVSTLKAKGSGYEPVEDLKSVKKIARKSPTGHATSIVSPDGEEVPGIEIQVGPDKLGAKPE